MAGENISGYSLVSMPSDQILPLGILSMEDKGTANLTGATISDLFIDSEVALPPVSPDYNLSTEINQSLSIELSVDTHLNLLQSLLSVLHLSAAFKLEKNRTVKMQLLDPKKNSVNEFKLDAYINSARINTISPTFTELLRRDQLYVITDILKCRHYTFAYAQTKSTDTSVGADAPLQGDGTARVRTASAGNDSITNAGDQFITIGLIAWRIFYGQDKNGKDSFRIRREEQLKTIKGDEDFPGEPLQAGQILIPVKRST